MSTAGMTKAKAVWAAAVPVFLFASIGSTVTASAAPVTPAATAQAVDIITANTDPVSGLNVADLAPGDTTEWSATVKNVSGQPISVLTEFLVDPDAEQSPLVTDRQFGLRASLDTCSQQWTPGIAGPLNATVFTCAGTESEVMGVVPVADLVGTPFTLTSSLAPAGSVFIRALVEFPSAAGNDFENLGGGIKLVFTSSLDDEETLPPSTVPPTTTPPSTPSVPGTSTPIPPGPPGGPGTPGVPGSPSGPTPGAPGKPSKPYFPGTHVPLPRTGSDLLGLLAVGVALVLAGSMIRAAAKRGVATDDVAVTGPGTEGGDR